METRFWRVTTVLTIFLCLLLSSCSGETQQRLNRFLKHYEHLSYDHKKVMYHHHRVRRSSEGQKEIELRFNAFDRTFNLRLYPDNSFLHKNVKFYKDAEPYSRTEVKSYLYSGYDPDDSSVHVTGSLAYGVFDGHIRTKDEIYSIEPSSRYMSNAPGHSIIYRHSDLDTSFLHSQDATTCGATTLSQQRRLSLLQQQPANEDSLPHLHKRQNTRNASLTRCTLKVIADYKFVTAVTESGDSSAVKMNKAISLLRNIISTASGFYERTDFDGDGSPDGIEFSVLEFQINITAPPASSPYANDFIGVEAFLNTHSENNWNDFCLSYLFTYRDFDGGVLGLAFVASLSGRGGICEDFATFSGGVGKTLNTGIVTLLNYGVRVPTLTSTLTFAHEAGHNFGSNHDPPECSPSSSAGGKYIMYFSANDGSQSNNRDFSSCSITEMRPIIFAKGQAISNPRGCFISPDDNCRNLLLDDGEDCDCGRSYNQITGICNNDPCCNGSICRLVNGTQCSPQQGSCCNSSCNFISEIENFVCQENTECALNQTCNGTTASCPTPEPRQSENDTAIPCNGGSNFCVNGQCTGSICVPLGLTDCECVEPSKQCDVCCIYNNNCTSTFDIANLDSNSRALLPNNQGKNLPVGFPCSNFTGYCDFLNVCRPVDSDSALRRIAEFFQSQAIQNLITLFQEYWWGVIVGAVVIVIILFGIVFVCHCLLPRPEHMLKRSERRKSIRQSFRHRRPVIVSDDTLQMTNL